MSRKFQMSAIAFCFVVAAGAAVAQSPHIVNVACCMFSDPANGGSNQTIIPVGTTVKWQRTDTLNHTVTSGLGTADPNAGVLFNSAINAANTMFLRTFSVLGTFPYFCTPHAAFGMTGTVFVLPAAASASTGTGCATSAGVISLTTPTLPRVGNAAFGLTISGGPPAAAGFLFLAASTAAPTQVTPACSVYLDLISLTALMQASITPTGPQALSAGGATTFAFPIPNAPSLGGITAAAQGLVLDNTVPGGFALTNAISIVVGA